MIFEVDSVPALRDAIAQANAAPDPTTIRIAPGEYPLDEPLCITGAHIAIESTGATFTGARRLPAEPVGAWSRDPNVRLYQLPPHLELDALYLGGQPLVQARYPNAGYATEDDLRARAATYADPAGGHLLALHNHYWGGNSYRIVGKDESHPTGLRLQWVGDNNRGSGYAPDALVVENVLEELDAPGEWWYDAPSGLLYLYPPERCGMRECADGHRPSEPREGGDVLEGACAHRLLALDGCHDVTVRGIAFARTARSLFREPYHPLLRGDWAIARTGAVTLRAARDIAIDGCAFDRIGGNALCIDGDNRSIAVTGCAFANIGASCIQVVGHPDAVWEPSFWERDGLPSEVIHRTTIATADHAGPRSDAYPRDIDIRGCTMRAMGLVEKQSSGVNLSVCRRVRIVHNTIHDGPRACININDGSFGGHEIAWNDIYDAQRETQDHGPLNAWGRDRFWSVPRYNTMGEDGAVKRPYALLDCVDRTTIHHNRFHHRADAPHTWGIDLDDGASNYEIHHNLCLGMGIKLREGFDRSVHHNVLVNGSLNIHCTYAQAGDAICDNLVLHSKPWAFAGINGDVAQRLIDGGYAVARNLYPEDADLPDFFAAAGYDAQAQRVPWRSSDRLEALAAHVPDWARDVLAARYGAPGCDAPGPDYEPVRAGGRAAQARDWLGAVVTEIDDAVLSATSSSRRQGVYVQDAPDGSAAHAMGLRAHDVLWEIDGQSVGIAQLPDAAGARMLLVFRNGEPREIRTRA